ncbi:hypothetical protein L3C95_32900 [Chitinophaga filiformis]|nr:hypothetical protein [Chitinophaga filiformis]
MKGEGNQQDYGMRVYDPRVGRFLSVDPISAKYPDLSSYTFAANSVVWLIDKNGQEPDRNQAGTVEEATKQWAALKNQTVAGILDYIQHKENAVRYIYTKDKGWIDLQHYFATLKYGKASMDALEPASGSKFLQGNVFGDGADASYFSYEDLPTNQFASEAENLTLYQIHGEGIPYSPPRFKSGSDLIESVAKNLENAEATAPEDAPNWKQIPFKDHAERKRIPETKDEYIKVMAIMPRTGIVTYSKIPVRYSEKEKEILLKTGNYIPQNHTSKPYNLNNFPAAPSSLERGDTRKGATMH